MRSKYAASIPLISLLGGCLSVTARVLPPGPTVAASPKAIPCGVNVLRLKPDFPYEEICAIQVDGTKGMSLPSAQDLEEGLEAKACELGADAIVVTQEYKIGMGGYASMIGVAVRYRGTAGAQPSGGPDQAGEHARDLEPMPTAPPGLTAARLVARAALHSGPDLGAPVLALLPGGTPVLVGASTHGFFRVRLTNGRDGYVDCAALPR